MSSTSKHYEKLDLLRVVSCIAVLLYHLNILKGGYLAVCTFFVMTGYLSVISAFKKEKFSFKDYYINKLLHIYLPLLVVVFITIAVIHFIPNINWLNLKPETTSVILGYNNFWQLKANLDYFARHINSPFIHFWYIGILLQFELVFPFIFVIFKKIGDKIHKLVPCILLSIIAIIFAVYFYISSMDGNIMSVYYNTFTRIFSILFGILLGFIHSYFNLLVPNSLKENKYIYYIYLLLLIIFTLLVDAKSIFFPISMILVTLISTRLIDYSVVSTSNNLSIFNKIISSISKVSYEIYLIQYPVIYIFQFLNIIYIYKLILILIVVILLSYLIHFGLDLKKDKKLLVPLLIILSFISIFGLYEYIISKDHTLEMKALEDQLGQNEKMMEQKQEEYAKKLKEEEDALEEKLKDLENDEKSLEDLVNNLSVVGVGDSVMLGAVKNLYKQFPNGYFDAKVSRTAWVLNDILKDLKSKNMLGNPIVLNLGANGDCTIECKRKIMTTIENRKVFWINATNDKDVHVNDKLNALAEEYDNLYIIDWASISKGHKEYFIVDGIHLTESGKSAYTKAIYDTIYENYLNEYNKQKEELIKKHEEKLKEKITFLGNDILINAFSYLKEEFEDANYITNSNYDYESLKKDLINSIEDGSLNYKVVIAFDDSINISEKELNDIVKLCDDHKLYLVSSKFNIQDTINIDFYEKVKENPEYLMVDRVHLSESGSKALTEILVSKLK